MITKRTEASNTVVTITTIMTTAAATTTMMRMVMSIISDQWWLWRWQSQLWQVVGLQSHYAYWCFKEKVNKWQVQTCSFPCLPDLEFLPSDLFRDLPQLGCNIHILGEIWCLCHDRWAIETKTFGHQVIAVAQGHICSCPHGIDWELLVLFRNETNKKVLTSKHLKQET